MDKVTAGDPRRFGKLLGRNLAGYWSYRTGAYRAIVKHYDDTLVVFAIRLYTAPKSIKTTEKKSQPLSLPPTRVGELI